MTNVLDKICEKKRHHIATRRGIISESALTELAEAAPATRGFYPALQNTVDEGHTALIAEIKKASPSKGIIRADFNPATLATEYEKGGATCLSVLTDEPYFQGHDEFLKQAKTACQLPALRKDFMLEPYQIIESRALMADAILLIMAALSDAQAKELEDIAFSYGMDVLVEVHDRAELDRALEHMASPLIGINNRNLKTLTVDISTAETLAQHIPDTKLVVCESGIDSHDDVIQMKLAGINCFLVGESLMRQDNVEEAARRLLVG